MFKRAVVILAAVLLAGLSGCAASETSQGPPASSGNDQWRQYDTEAGKLVNEEATWHPPKDGLVVGHTERIGLSIGTGSALKKKIDTLLPDSLTSSAGPVQVGPTMKATLRANPADADVTPSDAVNASTGSDIQMLWTWLVHPKRPTDALKLTVLLEVPLDNGHTISNEVPLSVPVARTFIYTVQEVGTHWATWSAVAATLASVTGWFLQRRRRRRDAIGTLTSPSL